MNAECTCNTCSGKIEFNLLQTGHTVQCPHCGIETILFIPKESLKSIENFEPYQESESNFEIKLSSVEYQLWIAGQTILFSGIAAFLIFIFLAISDTDKESKWLIFAFAVMFQGWIFSLIFKGFAEVIRLLRR